jgi:hypothetical protein
MGIAGNIISGANVPATSTSTGGVRLTGGVEGLGVKGNIWGGTLNGYAANIDRLRNPPTPTAVASTTGGTLAAGTYYAKLVAVAFDGFTTEASAEASVTTTGTTSSITWNWTAVDGAQLYRLYVGSASGAQTYYFQTSTTLSYTQTSSSGTAGTPPTVNTTGTLSVASNIAIVEGSATRFDISKSTSSSDPVVNFNLSNATITTNVLRLQRNVPAVTPGTTNTVSLGTASLVWSGIYSQTAVTVSSDRNLKTDIEDLTAAEQKVAQKIKTLMKKYRLKDAVNAKGDGARIHVGVIAQEVEQVFTDQGLDAEKYALFCRDVWYTDDQGNQVSADTENATRHEKLAIRYEELLAFIIAAL